MSRLWAERKQAAASPLRAAHPPSDARGYPEGYAAGLADARRTVEAEVAAERALLSELMTSIEALAPPSIAELTGAIEALAARLAVVAAGEAVIDGALLHARAQACAEALADVVGPARLRLHPHDLHLLPAIDLPLEPDWQLPRGSVRCEIGDAWASDGVAEACARIVEAAGL